MSTPPEKLSIVVFSGEFERVHYAFAMASAAAAIDRPVTLFFTMEAIRALAKGEGDVPGWHGIPGAAGRDAEFKTLGVATLEELIEASAALGARFLVCEMGLRAVGLAMADLRGDLAYEEGGIVTFLNDARADGAMLII